MKLMLIEPITWLCSRKISTALAHKIKIRGGGVFSNTCIFESPARRLALARHLACSLLAVAISVCMLSDANAEVHSFQSPHSGTSIYAYQLHGATIRVFDLVTPGKGFLAASIGTSDVRLQNAPTGLSVGSLRSDSSGDNIYLTFSCTGACRTISSAASVTIQVKRTAYIGVDTLPATPLWYGEGSFTVNTNPKVLVASNPTNSSTVTEAGSTATFTVQLGQVPSANVTVAVSSGDTTEGSVSPGTLTFTTTNWNTAQTVTVTGANDSIQDGNVSWNVVLTPSSTDTGYSGMSKVVNVAMTTSDDEGSPSFSINSPSVTEGDTGSANLTFTVTMSPESTSQYTVNYADAGTGSATSGTDYTALASSTTLTFAAGDTSKTITVSVTGDTLSEGNETVVITLSGASTGSTIGTSSGTGTITDDDPPIFSINSPSVVEGDSGSVTMTFTVSLNPAGASQHTVDYAQTGGTAISGTDYTTVSSGRLTFAAGTTSQTITVSVTGDTTDEGASETVVITLSNASAGTSISTASGTGTITDDDPKFSINSPSVTEGDSSSKNMTFTVSLSAAGASQYTVDFADAGTGSATSADYTISTSSPLTFAAGTTTQTITVSVTGDTLDEGASETVVITLSNASAGTAISTASGTGTITDDDPKFSINSPSVAEGDSSSVNLNFTVTLSAAGASQYTVDFADAGTGSATSADYTISTSSPLTFAAGTTSQTITVSVTGDTLNEGNETVVVTLSNASAGTAISTASGTGTIIDNDLAFSINSPSVVEGDSGDSNSLVFTVTLSAADASQTHTVDYAVSGTATSGTDYTAVTGTMLTFAASETSKTITVSVTGDTTDEDNETVVITLSNGTTGISMATGTGTIMDDDPKFSIGNASVVEGDSGSANLTFTVTLSASSTSPLTVDYARTGGTATSGTDFTALAASNMLTFPANSTSQTITVSVTGDTLDEPDETVVITLSNASAGTVIATATGTGTIRDDDPKFSIADASVAEGDSGSVNLVFTVTLSGTRTGSSSLTVDYASSDGATNGATAGTDYTAVSGTLTFASGTTSQTITVLVAGDMLDEANETLTITLSNALAGTGISTMSATGTITDDDRPSFSINSPTVAEGDSSTANLVFTVTLSLSSSSSQTVNYATSDGTATTANSDYTANSGTLTFAAGTTTQTVTVLVTGDTTAEPDETVTMTLSNPSSGTNIATSGGIGTGTITNDDAGLSISDASTSEDGNLEFTVTLSPSTSSQVTVSYATSSSGSGSGHATAGSDYTAITATTLTFAAGATGSALSQTITVQVTDDTENEPDETLTVTLSSASGAGIVTASGTGTITDNDTPSFSIDSPSVVEGDSSTASLEFTVSLSPASYQATTVNYAVTGGTATADTDYTALADSTTLTFTVGATTQTFTVSVTGDLDFEENETVVITLSGASPGTMITTASGTGTITNDDPGISIADTTVEEGDEDDRNMLMFTVTLSPAQTDQVTVDYASSDGTTNGATAGTDYTAVSGTLTFAASETSKTISVSVIGDILSEPNETVVVTLSNPNPSYTLVQASATGTITNDDEVVQNELDMEIVAEVAREVTTSVVAAVSNRVGSVVGGVAVAPLVNEPSVGVPSTGGFADSGLLSILARSVRHDRERDGGLERSEMSLYRSLDGASFAYSPSVLSANGSAGATGGHSGILTVWGSVDYRKMSGSGEGTLTWDGELASLNIGTDTLSESGVLVGVAIGASKGSFGYQGSISGSSGLLKMRVTTLNPYVGWSVSESASLWASVGYGRGKINYNDNEAEASSSKMKLASAAFGGRYRLFSADGSADGRLVQVDLKGEAWGLRNKVEGNEQRPIGSKSRAHGMRLAIERHSSGVLESGAFMVLSGEAGVRWDGGDGDTGAGFEMGGSADYSDSATGMKMVATARVLVDHESDNRKEWGAGLTVGCRIDGRETGMTYRSSLSHGQAESGVDSLWDSSAASRASSEEKSLATRLDTEVGYRFYGSSGLHTPYVGFGAEDSSRRDYRVGMRYAGGSAISSGLEFERREAGSKQPDHRVMLTGQMSW